MKRNANRWILCDCEYKKQRCKRFVNVLTPYLLDKPLIKNKFDEFIVPIVVTTVPIHVKVTHTIDTCHDSSEGIVTVFSPGPAVVTYFSCTFFTCV